MNEENLDMEFVKKEPIDKGWSCDRKFCVTSTDGEKYLLRITPKEKSGKREDMIRLQYEAASLGVSMCKPIEFGSCEEGVYSLQTWVNGEDAEEVIPQLPDLEQYAYGLEAGKILQTIHTIPAPDTQIDWEVRFNKKMDRKIKIYQECPIKFEGAENIISYMEANRYLLRNRPQSFQHGDYHIGNMMIENGKLVIIDFDRYDFGDPWEEFNRIVWCAQTAPIFASGMINGYFDNEVSLAFWKLLALYIGSNLLSSIPWAVSFGENEIQTMLHQAKDVLAWYDNMKNLIPTWYFEPDMVS
jgi:aminoglycoside phosphotransferase (APT) family kinase protein